MSALQVSALKLITISPPEVASYELVFPECSWVAKIPKDLTPDEVAPPLSWTQMSSLNVCVPSGMPIGFIETNRDVIGDIILLNYSWIIRSFLYLPLRLIYC